MQNTKNAEIVFADLSWVPKLRFRIFQVMAAVVRNLLCRILFIFFNLDRLLIFNDGSRFGSVTRNMDQLIQV